MDKIPMTYTVERYLLILKAVKVINILIRVAYLFLIVGLIWAFFHNLINIYGIFGFSFIAIEIYLLFLWVKSWQKENDELAIKNEETWGLGAEAELMVYDSLGSLPSGYKFIPDFRKKIGGNIDYIIVGEKGVFIIEVKANGSLISYSKNILYAFNSPLFGNAIRQTVGNATYISDILKKEFNKFYFVQGILEFPRGQIDLKTINGKINHALIGEIGVHNEAIAKSSYHLSEKEIILIVNYLNKENSEAKAKNKQK